MNWYKKAQIDITILKTTSYGKLTLRVNGEVREYQLPYTAVGSYSDIANMIQKKQVKKLNEYLKWLEQFQLEEVKNMDVGVENILSKEEGLSVVPAGV